MPIKVYMYLEPYLSKIHVLCAGECDIKAE